MNKIEILYFEGCPNHQPAVALVRQVVDELGMDASIVDVEVFGPDDAKQLRFLGSPSIHIDGVDVEPEARTRTDFGFACRTYNGEGLPPRAMLIAALEGTDTPPGSGITHEENTAPDCCAGDNVEQVQRDAVDSGDRKGLWAAGGSFVAAIVASACCWLPLILLVFGVSAGSVGVFFEKTRPIFLVLSAILLATGFYYAYFRKEQCAPGSACETPRPKVKPFNRAMLWVSTVGVITFALFPRYAGIFQPPPTDRVVDASVVNMASLVIKIDGMSCESCTVTVRNELMEVPGVLDATVAFDEGIATVSINADVPPAEKALTEAVKEAGYTGHVVGDTNHKPQQESGNVER